MTGLVPAIVANDHHFFTPEHFAFTKQALRDCPDADKLHFILYTNHNNLKIEVPVHERYYTSNVLLRVFESYKPNLVLH